MFNWLQHKLGIISLVETIAHHYRERDIAMEQWKYVLSRLSEIDDHLLKMQETLEANHPKSVMTPCSPLDEEISRQSEDRGSCDGSRQQKRDGKTQPRVLGYLQTRKGQSVHYKEVMEALGSTKGQANSALAVMAKQGIVTRTGRGAYVLVCASGKVQEHILGYLRKSRQASVKSSTLACQLGWTKGQITAALSPMLSRGEVVRLKPGVYALSSASKEGVSHDFQ